MKSCMDCGQPLTGRVGKKFCSPYCKSAYHYKQNLGKPQRLYNKIDKQLKTNRRILKEYNKGGKVVVRKELLIGEGFDPKYFTHYWKNYKGQVYLFCYEFGFLATKDNGRDKFVLVTWQDYMEEPTIN